MENEEPATQSEKNFNRVLLAGMIALVIFKWEVAKGIGIFLLTLGILIAVHEWGHFIAAKSVGVTVFEFALGMGKKLVTYMRRNGTDYTIRMLPIGGFVNLKGMQPDDPITPDGLSGRRPAERALVYLAGPLMNVILGASILLFSGCLIGTWDESQVVVQEVVRKSIASKMPAVKVNGQAASGVAPGLRIGDLIVQVNGAPVRRIKDVTDVVNTSVGKQVSIVVRRGRDEIEFVGTPSRDKAGLDTFLLVQSVPPGTQLALQPGDQISAINGEFPVPQSGETPEQATARVLAENAGKPVTVEVWRNSDQFVKVEGIGGPIEVKVGPGERYVGRLGFQPWWAQGPRISVAKSVEEGKDNLIGFVFNLGALFTKPKALTEGVGGPIAIWKMLSESDKLSPLYYTNMLASLSLSLAFFNLLPVPILDGGHMLLLTLEVIRRRRLEPEVQRTAAAVGLAIIGVLVVLIMSKDIWKHFL